MATKTSICSQYYIDYYDMNDGWLGWEYIQECRPDRIFSDLTVATDCRDELNKKLVFGNVRCGEYYAVKKVITNL